jgi:hypothetical protein
MASRANKKLKLDDSAVDSDKAIDDEPEALAVTVRYIESAIMDESGHVEYSYTSSGSSRRKKSGITTSEHDDAFADIYTLGYSPYRKNQYLRWRSAEGGRDADVTYGEPVSNIHVDPVHMRMACGWRCRAQYRVDVWNLETNKLVAIFEACARRYPSETDINIWGNRLLVSCAEESRLYYWDVETRSVIFTTGLLTGATYFPRRCLFQLADYSILIATCLGSFAVIEAVEGKELMSSAIDSDGCDVIYSVAANAESSVFCLFYDYGASVYDAKAFTNIANYRCVLYRPHPIGFGPDCGTIIIVSAGGYTIWNYHTGTKEAIVVSVVEGQPVRFGYATYNARNNMIIGYDELTKLAYAVNFEGHILHKTASIPKGFVKNIRGLFCLPPAPLIVLL